MMITTKTSNTSTIQELNLSLLLCASVKINYNLQSFEAYEISMDHKPQLFRPRS